MKLLKGDWQIRAAGLAHALSLSLLILGLALAADAALTLPRVSRAILWQLWFCGTLLLLVHRLRNPGPYSRARLINFVGLVLAALVCLSARGAAERLQRFCPPWPLTARDQPYRLVVPAGDVTVARDTPLTLTAYVDPPPRHHGSQAILLVRSLDGTLTRHEVQTDEAMTFGQTLPPVHDHFDYCFQLGSMTSQWFRVRVSDPVNLLPTSEVLIRPPAYAEAQIAARTQLGWSDIEALAYSQLDFTLRFNLPASRVQLTWKPLDAEPVSLMVNLDADGRAAIARLEARHSGVLTLTVFSTEQLATEYIAAVRVQADQPPRFEKIIGLSPGIHAARPDDRVLIEFAARDDLQLAQAWIEYSTNQADDTVQRWPLTIPGLGTNRVDGVSLFHLSGKGREGDTLRFRLVLADHRHILNAHLGPQQVCYPATGWLTLKIQRNAKPLAEQEIAGQRERVHNGLSRGETQLDAVQQILRQLPAHRLGEGALPLEVSLPLREARQLCHSWAAAMNEFQREVSLIPSMQPLQDELAKLTPLGTSLSESLSQVESLPSRETKTAKFQNVLEHLNSMQQRMKTLQLLNVQLSERRAAIRGLRELASDQRELTEFVQPEQAALQQANLTAQLARLISDCSPLSQSVQAAAEVQRCQLYDQVRQRLHAIQRLDLSLQRLLQAEAVRLLRQPLGAQSSITKLAEQLAETTATAARIAGRGPLQQDSFRSAREALFAAKAEMALAEQEKACRELERLAQGLRQGAAVRVEPREATRQLARWLDDFRRRISSASQNQDEVLREWKDFLAALKLVTLTDAGPAYQQTLDQLTRDLERVGGRLGRASHVNPSDLDLIQKAVDSLAKLVELTPTRAERLRHAKPKLEGIRRDLDALRTELERLVASPNRFPTRDELNTIAAQLRMWLDRFKLLMLPGFEPRLACIRHHVDQATSELQAHLPDDAIASLLWSRKYLDQLRLALEGVPVPEEQLAELYQQQRQFHQRLMTSKSWSITDLQELEAVQREHTKALMRLNVSDIAMTLSELRQQSESLEFVFRKPEPLHVCREKSARYLSQLEARTQQVRGFETDLARVRRLILECDQLSQISRVQVRHNSPQAVAEAARRADQSWYELSLVRVGAATIHRRTALDGLKKLREAIDTERRLMLLQSVLEALQKLEQQMRDQPQRSAWADLVAKIPSEAERLQELTGRGKLPSQAAAEQLEALLKAQQACRDATASALAELQRGPNAASQDLDYHSPPGASPLLKVIDEQAWLARHPEIQSLRLLGQQTQLIRDLLTLSTDLRRYAFQQNGSVPDRILSLAADLDMIRTSLSQSLDMWKARHVHRVQSHWNSTRETVRLTQLTVEKDIKPEAIIPPPEFTRVGAALTTAQEAMRDVLQKLALPDGSPLAREAMHAAADALLRAAQSLP